MPRTRLPGLPHANLGISSRYSVHLGPYHRSPQKYFDFSQAGEWGARWDSEIPPNVTFLFTVRKFSKNWGRWASVPCVMSPNFMSLGLTLPHIMGGQILWKIDFSKFLTDPRGWSFARTSDIPTESDAPRRGLRSLRVRSRSGENTPRSRRPKLLHVDRCVDPNGTPTLRRRRPRPVRPTAFGFGGTVEGPHLWRSR